MATPIGNLGDISPRAIETLRSSGLILAEDTRVSKRLLDAFGIATPLRAFHAYNENQNAAALLDRIATERLLVSLISDAGTPLISDPGFPLIRLARERAIDVTAIPGPCAAIAALVISGMPTDRFLFEGFLPPRAAARRERLRALREEQRTVLLYEAPHRLRACLEDTRLELGDDRGVFVARELTKLHETCYRATLGVIVALLDDDAYAERGELVIVLAPAAAATPEDARIEQVLRHARRYLSARDAIALTCDMTGAKRNDVYRISLALDSRWLHTPDR
ncbi:MAG: 16S rRNA (cytidine(1402)-2'-O)-methyltransferase [Gammaproteobacteria bacterium]|nr:16S rRNA (cytidine(1402)-2'-O)-methyltransferase [Gammaproteobacteria bacterium]